MTELLERSLSADEAVDAFLEEWGAKLDGVTQRYLMAVAACQRGEAGTPLDVCAALEQPLSPSGISTGRFISLEGGDGSGKTTQAKALAAMLGAKATRALGGGETQAGLALRDLILDPDYRWTPMAEALLTISIYRETLVHSILPALAAGEWVVCDRWLDTILVFVRDEKAGVTLPVLRRLYKNLAGDLRLDLTFLLDLPFDEAVKRRTARQTGRVDRNEDKGEPFHRWVFDELRRTPSLVHVDALKPVEAITAEMARIAKERLG